MMVVIDRYTGGDTLGLSKALVSLVLFSLVHWRSGDLLGQELLGKSDALGLAVISEFERDLTFPSPTQLVDIQIPDSDAGSKVGTTIRLVNKLSGPIQLKTVHKSCSCIREKVPYVKIDVDGSEEVFFEFDIEKRPTKLDQRFSVTIQCEGACDQIQIGFRSQLKNAVVFRSTELLAEYAKTERKKITEIAIDTSDPMVLTKSDLTFSNELSSMSGKFVNKNGKWYVHAEFDPTLLSGPVSQGEVSIVRDKKTVAVARLTLRERPPVEVLPAPLNFYLADDGRREAIAIVRFAGDSTVGIRSIELQVEGKKSSDSVVTWQQMTGTRSRIRISLPLNSEIFLKKSLAMRVETTSGQAYPLDVFYTLSN